MRISIAVFAYNAEKTIAQTLESLFHQDLITTIHDDIEMIEVWCMANGCTDQTVSVVNELYERNRSHLRNPRLKLSLHECAVAGKSRAWNQYVHNSSDQRADILFCMDADATLPTPAVLSRLRRALMEGPELVVATGKPLKHIFFKEHHTLGDRISMATSRFTQKTSATAICGWLYAIRGEFARTCWLPVGLQVDDGFLRAMVVTDQFRSAENGNRVRHIEDAPVCSEAYSAIGDIVRHEIRLMEGLVVNVHLFSYLWANSGVDGAGSLIGKKNQENEQWATEIVNEALDKAGSWAIPWRPFPGRLATLGKLPGLQRISNFPIAMLRTTLDCYVSLIVNRRLRAGKWGRW